MNRFYVNVGQQNVKPGVSNENISCLLISCVLFTCITCIQPVGFPDIFFASDIYIGLHVHVCLTMKHVID